MEVVQVKVESKLMLEKLELADQWRMKEKLHRLLAACDQLEGAGRGAKWQLQMWMKDEEILVEEEILKRNLKLDLNLNMMLNPHSHLNLNLTLNSAKGGQLIWE